MISSEVELIVMKKPLWQYLVAWMAEAGLVYDCSGGIFVTEERMAELDKMRAMDTSYEWGIWV